MTKKKPYLSGFPMFFDFITVKLPNHVKSFTFYFTNALYIRYNKGEVNKK